MNLYWSEVLVLIAVTIITRVMPRLIKPDAINTDTYYHFLRAEKIRINRFRLPVQDIQMQQFGGLYYPSLYHYLLAVLPRAWRERIEPWTGAIIDSIYVLLFFVAAQLYFKDDISRQYIFLLGLAFSLNPLLTYLSAGLRAYQGTPRILGQLVYAASLVGWIEYANTGYAPWLVLFIGASILVLLSSRFAAQAWFFTVIFMAIVLMDMKIVLAAIATIGITVLITKGAYLSSLREHINNVRNYARFKAQYDNLYSKRMKDYRPPSLLERLKWLISHNEISIYFIRNSSLLILVAVLLWGRLQGQDLDLNKNLLTWLLATQLLFLLTSRYGLWFLGEAERYLEYGVIPLVILLGSNIVRLSPLSAVTIIVAIIAVYYIPFYIAQVVMFVIWARRSYDDRDYDELIKVMRKIEPRKVLSILKDGPWKLAYLTKHFVVYRPVLGSLNNMTDEIKAFFSFVPLPKSDLTRYVTKYGASLIAVEKRIIELQKQQNVLYDFNDFVKVYENDGYILYECI